MQNAYQVHLYEYKYATYIYVQYARNICKNIS